MPKKAKHQENREARLVSWYKWEFLRRNPEYRKDHDSFIGEFGKWFAKHGYWYDQTCDPWGHENLRYFAKTIAPKAKAICEKWAVSDPYSPDWEFTREGLYFYKPHFEVFLPTECGKEQAGKLWDLSGMPMSWDDLERQLREYESAKRYPRPDHQFVTSFDLRLPLKTLLDEAAQRVRDRKGRYDRKHPPMKIVHAVRRRLDLYGLYLEVWDLATRGEKFEYIGALLFPRESARLQRAKDSFKRAKDLVNGGYKELR
jgi:hypothetical protein